MTTTPPDTLADCYPQHQPMFLRPILRRLDQFAPYAHSVLDAGCGDGNFVESLQKERGYEVFGIDASRSGIEIASARNIGRFEQSSLYSSLTDPFGVKSFDVIVSVEVIEHLYAPSDFIRQTEAALEPGGILILTTPYWGYVKNLALAVTNRVDQKLTALWEGGHIKHWSRKTLTQLVLERKFEVLSFDGSDGLRPPYLWSAFVMAFRRIA